MIRLPLSGPRGSRVRLLLAVLAGTGLLAPDPGARAAEAGAGTPAGPVSFHRQIRPILQAECQGCHQPAKAKGDYVLTDVARLRHPGASGTPPVVTDRPDESHLLQVLTPKNGEAEMPKGRPPLPEPARVLIRQWIAEGARDDTPADHRSVIDQEHPPVYTRPPAVTALDFSPDGSLLAVAGYHEILLHASDGSGLVARLVGLSERIQSVRFSPDGTLLAVAGGLPARMGEIQIWDVASRQLRHSVPVGHDTVYGAAWSPDGTRVSFGCPDKTVRAIDAATGRQVLQQMAHEDWVLDTVFSTQGTHVVSVGRDMTAKLTEVASQRFIDNITSITPGALRGGLASVARHPSRDEILVGGADGVPQIFQVFRQAVRKIGDNATLLRKFPALDGRIFDVDYSPDGDRIAAAASLDGRGAIHVYASRFDPAIPADLLKAYEKTSGEYTAAEREAIEKFTTAEVRQLHALPIPETPVYALRFSPDGRRLAAGTGNGVILVHDVESGRLDLVFAAAPQAGTSAGDAPASAGPADANTPSAPSPALARPSGRAEGTEAEPALDPARVRELQLEPATVRLASRGESVQLLVTARNLDGETTDVTRQARFEWDRSLGALTPGGRFQGLRSGRGRIVARLGDREAAAEVDLTGFQPGYEADFVRDVNPVLSHLGCNAGTCHGAKEGKSGFKLSLRGYDPVFDVRALTDDLAARRINFAAPDESLMLLKGTGAVPHEGGARTSPGSDAYGILRQWIAGGARLDPKTPRVTRLDLTPSNPVIQQPGARQQMRIVATYADGRTRDVTALAVVETGNGDVAAVEAGGLAVSLRRGEAPLLARYEGAYAATTLTVMGDRTGFTWQDPPVHNRIDALVAAKWKRMKIKPSGLCDDATFLRRVTLDLTGLPPTAAEVRDFLANPRDTRSKRDALIERLLGSPAFVDHWTGKWADLLQVNRKFLGEEGARAFRDWIRTEVAANTPHDEFVRRLLTATGSNRENPAAAYWKILRTPTEAMENTTHLFLATRFNCNKCHDHPFERWTQDQYYELAQYFARVELRKDDASGDRRIGGTAVEGSQPLFEIVADKADGAVKHDRTGRETAPSFPYPAGRAEGAGTTAPAPASRRAELARWLTSPDNRFFAASQANRLWGYLLGVGLIEPLDDLRAGNPPSNPELLDHLAREFVESGFNTRHLLRQICQSRTYQLALETNPWNADDRINYSHALPRRLPAEVLFDSVQFVTGATPAIPGASPGLRAAQLIDSAVDVPGGLLATLGRPPRESACECERSNDIRLTSVLSLLSGPAVAEAVQNPDSPLARLAESDTDDRQLAEELFLRVLNRPPRDAERDLVSKAAADLDREHARLTQALAQAEAAWEARRPGLERDRVLALERAEKNLAYHLVERGPRLAAEQRARSERLATAEAALRDAEAGLDERVAAWESSLTTQHLATAWIPLDPKSVQGSGSAQLRKLPDGTVRSTASVGELPTFTVTAETPVAAITGVKLEVLPEAELPGFGPGHAAGDFVLAEFIVESASKTNADRFARVTLRAAATDRIADGYRIADLHNGIAEQGRPEGWRLGGDFARPHWAAFAFEKPAGDTNGTVLRFTLHHRFEAPFEIGRFRLWISTSATVPAEGLPQGLASILQVPPGKRTPEQAARLRDHVRSQTPGDLAREFERTLARQPAPADARLAELELELARASRPVPVDEALLRLREDVRLSERQLARRRVTAVQDLTWALINTPAFLFNH